MRRSVIGAFLACALVALLAGGAWLYARTGAFMEQAGQMAGSAASDALGVEVNIGKVSVQDLHSLTVQDVTIYDKQAKPIIKADSASIGFRLLASISNPVEAVRDVTLTGVEATLIEREDGSWNVADLASSGSGNTKFYGKVTLQDADLTVHARGKSLHLQHVDASADCADYPLIKADVAATCEGASLHASGTYRKERQILNVALEDVDLAPFLPLLPDGVLPEGVTIAGGHVSAAHVAGQYYGGVLSFTGDAAFDEGSAEVLGKKANHLGGTAFFTDAQALLNVDGEVDGQKANVHGKVKLGAASPELDLDVSSDSFDPSVLRADLPYKGAAKIRAHVTGSAGDPTVDGTVNVAAGEVLGTAFSDASAHVRFRGGHIYAQDVRLSALGGTLSGEAEVTASDLSYAVHAKGQNLDVAKAVAVASDFADVSDLSDLSGQVSFDGGASGIGADLASCKAYGSVELLNGRYRELPIERMNASFFLNGKDLRIDYASLHLPNRSSIGVAGTLEGGSKLDLAFYGGHFDLSLLQKLLPEADVKGLSDFEGTLRGDTANPNVDFKFTAMDGSLFEQPFDNVRVKAGGSLDGVTIEDFSLVKDGKQRWFVEGSVGLTGERRIDLRADTVGVRAEDLAALIAPDQPITGNVDNTIRFTGTLDNPYAVGYIHFYRGSYQGILLSGMDGDYTLCGGVVTLKDFHIFSPWVDVDVNGTVNQTGALNLDAQIHEMDMARLASKFPYPVSGKGKFTGHIGGSVAAPSFQGVLNAPSIFLNGEEIEGVSGELDYAGSVLYLRRFGFQQGEGEWAVEGSLDTVSHAMSGSLSLETINIRSLAAILNLKNDVVDGTVSGSASLGGTYDNPTISAEATAGQAAIAGYDVHDAALKARMADHVVYVEKLSAQQGTDGSLEASGSAQLGGALTGKIQAKSIALGMFTKAAGIESPVQGTADANVQLGGTVENPSADVQLSLHDGGFSGAAFDTVEGDLHLKNGIIDVKTLRAWRSINGQTYEASAKGVVPLRALTAKDASELDDYERMKLLLSLDRADLSLLPTLSKQVEWAMGATNGEVEITGTLAHPLADGHIVVPDGAMKLKPLEVPITSMVMRIDFHNNVMTVREFSGRMGEGSYEASGSITMDGLRPAQYTGSLTAQKLDVRSTFFRGPVDASLKVEETEVYGEKMPKVSGELNLHDCVISVPTIPDMEGDMPNLALDFDLHVGNHVHAYSPHLYDMYLTDDAHFGGTLKHPKTRGTIAVKRGGTVTYLKNVFTVREGAAYFNQFDTFLPSIAFFADTRLSRTRVYLALNGPLRAMEFKLTSSPEMSQEEILKMLTLRTAYKNGEANLDAGDLLVVGLQMSLLAEVEDTIRNLLWLDKFTIASGNGSLLSHSESETTSDRDLYVEMGKYLSDKLMIRYNQGISGNSKSRVGVQYDFNERYGASLDKEGGDYIVGAEVNIRF